MVVYFTTLSLHDHHRHNRTRLNVTWPGCLQGFTSWRQLGFNDVFVGCSAASTMACHSCYRAALASDGGAVSHPSGGNASALTSDSG